MSTKKIKFSAIRDLRSSMAIEDKPYKSLAVPLALKVADRQDSQEMLKMPGTADITQAGRAYLQRI